MFKKILLAADGSAHANHAAEKAAELVSEIDGASLTVLHVLPSLPAKSHLFEKNFDVKGILEEKAKTTLIRTLLILSQADISYQLETAVGNPAEEIVTAATQLNSDLIIIGSRGLTTIGEVLLGSVSHAVAHDAQCPVMIVK